MWAKAQEQQMTRPTLPANAAMLDAFLHSIAENPSDDSLELILADWLEEQNDPRAELLRLQLVLRQAGSNRQRQEQEDRMRQLILAGVPPCLPRLTNSVGMEFVLIKPGSFLMGSPGKEHQRGKDEVRHKVTLSKAFRMQTTLVTQKHWQAVMGNNPSHFKGDDLPVEKVNWFDCVEFCIKLSEKENKKPCYRLDNVKRRDDG